MALCLSLFRLYNKMPQTGWLTNKKNLFVTVLEAGSQKSGASKGFFLSSRLLVSTYGGKN